MSMCTFRSQKKGVRYPEIGVSLDLKLQEVVIHQMCALDTEPKSSGRASFTLHYRAISPVLSLWILT